MSAVDFENAVKEAQKEVKSLDLEYEALMATIQPKMSALLRQRESAQATCNLKLTELFQSVTYDDLVTPDSAALVYELAWNHTNAAIVDRKIGELFPETYVLKTHDYYGTESQLATPVLSFIIGVPATHEAATLERTAELLAPVYAVASALSPQARIGVLDDDMVRHDIYSIRHANELWSVSGRFVELYAHESLVEVLKNAPTYY